MRLADQWRRIEEELPPDWADARLQLTVEDGSDPERAATLLGPAAPGRFGKIIRFTSARRGGGVGPEGIRRLLRGIDEEGIRGVVRIVRALSDTNHVGTQGPVWYIGGRSV